jgi:hypothetical protein
MTNKFLIFICFCWFSFTACQNNTSSENKQDNMQEGKDYIVLKRFRITDNQGFNQPVEATSFLLPANWTVNSDVKWNGMNKCLPEILQASLQAKSPDGKFELFVLPTTQFDWSDDPVYLDAMQRGFNMHSCHIQQPLDAAGYIENVLGKSMNATIATASVIPALQQQMDAGAAQMTNAARQAGNNAYTHRGSAAEGNLQFSDGKEGLAFCTVMQTIVNMMGTQGGMSNTFQCYVSMRMVLKYKKDDEALARQIMSTLFSSARVNPAWQTAVQQVFANIGRNAQIELGKQIAISHAAQEEMSKNIIRNWESRQSTGGDSGNTASNGESPTEQFGQYLRGVDSWKDENGNKVELTSGYSNAWSKGDGTYILSNNPAFDPNVTFQEDWKRLKQ